LSDGTIAPFAEALQALEHAGARGGLVARVDQSGNAFVALAVKMGHGWSVGAEFSYDKAKGKPAGWVGVEWTFGASGQ
jgi:hypothetical protein